jgi:hypothetical protein
VAVEHRAFVFFCLKNLGLLANSEFNGRRTARVYLDGSFDSGCWTSNNRWERLRGIISVGPRNESMIEMNQLRFAASNPASPSLIVT